MKQQIKTLGLITVLAVSTLNLTACTSEDVALGAGVIIGAVVADGLNSGNDRHAGHYNPPQPPPYRMPPPPHRRPGNFGMTLNMVQIQDLTDAPEMMAPQNPSLTLTMVDSEVAATAKHFQISEEAAAKVWSALTDAKSNNFTKIEAMGLTHEDLILMAQGENPSVSALESVSAELGLELGETHQVFQQMKSDLAAGL